MPQNLMKRIVERARYLFSGRGGGGGYYPVRATQIPSARFDWIAEAGDFRQNPVVSLGLDWLVRNATSVPLKLYIHTKFGEKVELENHPILGLLEEPNPVYSGNALLQSAIIDLMCVGNAYWAIVPNFGGQAAELYWLDGRYVSPDFPNDGSVYLNSWKYIPAGTGHPEIYEPDQVVDFKRGVDPWNDRLGYSPLLACCREIALTNMASGYTAAIMKNVGVTNLVITPEGENAMTAQQAQDLKYSIAQAIGLDNKGMPLVLTNPSKISSVGTNPADLLLPEVDSRAVARICSAMGLSPMVLGLPDEGKTYANYREAQRAAWINSVIPMHRLLLSAITKNLLKLYDPSRRLCLEYDYSAVEALADDQESLAKKAALLFEKGIATRNEARVMVGLPEQEDGDMLATDKPEAETANLDDQTANYAAA